jgi:16S rRNA pseudouridine516 synthase
MRKRLDQILANCGYCSRSEAKKLIKKGRITVDGVVQKDPANKAEAAAVGFDGEPLDHPDGILVMLNKPEGYVCSHDSGEGPLIYDFFPELWLARNPIVSSIGRLDKDTTGLILVTDYTQLIHRFTSPKHHIEKTYRVTVAAPLRPELAAFFAAGTLILEDEKEPCLPARLEPIDDRHADLTLTEGRYHQVKRMFAAAGYEVTALHRWRFGPYTLGDLDEGDWKDVAVIEV